MSRHPREIVPVDNKEDLLVAIYEAVEGLRADLRASAKPARSSKPDADVAPVSTTSAPAQKAKRAPRKTPTRKKA